MRRARRGGTALLVAGVAGCVRVDPGPSGVASARLDEVPPSIVAGDVLRGVAGDSVAVTVQAFDESGRRLPTAPVRFVYVPSLRDTLNRLLVDTALRVDSLTGAVHATTPFTLSRGLVAVRVGDRLQLVDTLDIVPTPNAATTDTAVADTFALRYDCADTSRVLSQRPLTAIPGGIDTLYAFNAVGPFRVRVFGDSAGTRVPVRRRLVRWSLDGAPMVPPASPAGGSGGAAVPALGIVSDSADRLLTADTTDVTGRSGVRLRVRPNALVPAALADDVTFRLRADVQPGPVPIDSNPRYFSVRLQRRPRATCR